MKWNKIVKVGLVGLAMYAALDLSYQMGKGRTIANLSYFQMTPEEAKDVLAMSKQKYPAKFILWFCDERREEEFVKYEKDFVKRISKKEVCKML